MILAYVYNMYYNFDIKYSLIFYLLIYVTNVPFVC